MDCLIFIYIRWPTFIHQESNKFMDNVRLILFTYNYLFNKIIELISDSSITKDNPAFSMINDSDEEVLYGSDEDNRRLLTRATRNTDDSD